MTMDIPTCVHPNAVARCDLLVTFFVTPQVQRLRGGSCRGPYRRPEEDGEAAAAYAGVGWVIWWFPARHGEIRPI